MTTIGIFTIATKHYIEHWKRLIESLDQVIFENIKILVRPEQEEIYRILRRTNEKNFTENTNGIFFDLMNI